MKFKKPTTKKIAQVAKGLAAYEVGRRVSRGIVGLLPTNKLAPEYIKSAVAITALVAAVSYTGKNSGLVTAASVGVASEQVGSLIDTEAAKHLNRNVNDGMAETFLNDAMGLNCPHEDYYVPSLNMPSTIESISWDSEYQENEVIYTDFEDVEQPAFDAY